MLQTVPYNLNQMSFNAAISLIRALIQAKVKVKKVYVDTVGDPVKYRNYLQDMFVSYNIDFTVEKKADALYTCVSAASIVAKVFIPNPCFSQTRRDSYFSSVSWEEPYMQQRDFGNLGSGYTSGRYSEVV